MKCLKAHKSAAVLYPNPSSCENVPTGTVQCDPKLCLPSRAEMVQAPVKLTISPSKISYLKWKTKYWLLKPSKTFEKSIFPKRGFVWK